MESEIQGYLTEFGILRGQFNEAVKGIGDEAGNWRPLPEGTNSIYAIISHLIGAQNYWVRMVINGEKLPRDRAAEFLAAGRLPEILSQWEKACSQADSIISRLSLAQLAETRAASPASRGEPVTVRWCILHVLSHLATHLGHVQLTRQLWEQRRP
jgi:hypothetical protein